MTSAEIVALRDQAAKCVLDGPANREKMAAALAKTAADRLALLEQLGRKDLPEKDRKELEKKQGSIEREQGKQQAALEALDEELAKLPEVCRRFDAWLNQGQQQSASGADLPQLIEKARQRADVGRLAILNELTGASAARQRQLADLLEPTEPDLAQCLHALAAVSDGSQRTALARLPRLRSQSASRRGWFSWLGAMFAGAREQAVANPTVIPADGPRDLDYESRLASLYEGELIGEISCLNRTPRSATVTMTRDGFVVELMRNILDMMERDTAYKARVESGQRQRLINSALREISIFADLPEAELARIGREMEFKEYEPGSLICDEHEESDCLYVIGNGIIKVVTGVSWLLPSGAKIDSADLAPVEKISGSLSGKDTVLGLNRIIANTAWRNTAEVGAIVDREKLVPRIWRMLASTEHGGMGGLVRCNRMVLNGLDGKAFPAIKAEGDATDKVFAVADFADWKKLSTLLVAEDKKPDDPTRTVWDRLHAAIQDRLRQGRTAEMAQADREAVVAALNGLLRTDILLLTQAGSDVAQGNANLALQLLPMLAEGQLWSDFDFHRWNRCLNRLTLEAMCPKALAGLQRPSGLPNILSYRSRNEVLGEIGVVFNQPRSATLVTYNHPKNDPKREVGRVQLFRILKPTVDEMIQRLPHMRQRLEELAAQRRNADKVRSSRNGQRTPVGESIGDFCTLRAAKGLAWSRAKN